MSSHGGHGTRGRFGGRVAFVLDDEADIGEFVCNVLAGAGFVCRQFSTPDPFLIDVKAYPPELIILDLALDRSDAVDIIRELEAANYKGKLLLFSGRDESTLHEVQAIGKRHGLAMLPCLSKPFRASELKDRIQAIAEVSEARNDRKADPAAVDLATALRNGKLELWYQPKIDLKGLSVCGAEALLRARGPEQEVVLPALLLPPPGHPVYHPLSRFVLQRAMADWKMFAGRNISIRLAINVPASVVQAPSFMRAVRELVPQEPEFPGMIIEITENDLIGDPTAVQEAVTQLKLYNVHMSIDDFGSAYSSLARLLEVPCVELKLDRIFVAGCAMDPDKRALCQAAIDLAHHFNAIVCAEGVETPADLRALIAMGCDVAQGYLFAKPMPPQLFAQSLLAAPAEAPAAGPLTRTSRMQTGICNQLPAA